MSGTSTSSAPVQVMFAVVYGTEYEDIAYFMDESKARYRLYMQMTAKESYGERFYPFIQSYIEHNGSLVATDRIMYIDKNEFTKKTLEEVTEDPRLINAMIKISPH